MLPGKTIEYRLSRRVHYIIREGAYFEDTKGNVKGFLFDPEFDNLLQGTELKRNVDQVNGDFSFNTVPFTTEKLPIYLRPFVREDSGQIKDDDFLQYPFEHGETISIKIIRKNYKAPITKGESVDLIIRTNGA